NDSDCSYTEEYVGAAARVSVYGDARIVVPYSDEPLADEAWLEEYRREKEEEQREEEELKKRLDGSTKLKSWCECGKCDRILLQNAMECRCCLEIDLCVEAINDELVFRELGCVPSCMTPHPGFRPVCLETWSLRLASTKYKTRKGQKYRHTGSVPEEKFLRSVSYREFTSLVYGIIGKRRVPLPACAYHAIRNKFKENDIFTGYVDDVNE
ncbi:uncharacterized protein LOC135686047, partial [Rhopilema esculentum]|uniref:uncharacterized protein LOC135686047 n=1 Tax=Rhopilema esculentum TaxID=499914 RepID=UPI0031D56B66